MFFLWPEFLWLLAALLLLPAAYVWLLRRRKREALVFSSLGVARMAAAGRNWRRHVPPVLLLLACSLLAVAAARPVARVSLPWARATIMLAMDVSLSMRVTDVVPNRMVAAQEAAKAFLRELPRDIEVGLVTFAGSTQVAQRATLDRPALVAAIDAIQMQRATAVGNAIVMSLAELFPDDGIDVGEMTFGGSGGYGGYGGGSSNGKPRGRSLDEQARPQPRPFTPVEPGSHTSAAIILLTDGRRTTGIDTLEAARMAADRGVRVHVVGLGSPDGAASMGESMSIYLQLDEPTLREVARMTGGEYHHAGTAEKLRSVYQNLGTQLQVQTRETEVTALFAAAAALLALASALLSTLWFRRLA